MYCYCLIVLQRTADRSLLEKTVRQKEKLERLCRDLAAKKAETTNLQSLLDEQDRQEAAQHHAQETTQTEQTEENKNAETLESTPADS